MITHLINFILRFKMILICLLFHTKRFSCGSCANYLYDKSIKCDVDRMERISMFLLILGLVMFVLKGVV